MGDIHFGYIYSFRLPGCFFYFIYNVYIWKAFFSIVLLLLQQRKSGYAINNRRNLCLYVIVVSSTLWFKYRTLQSVDTFSRSLSHRFWLTQLRWLSQSIADRVGCFNNDGCMKRTPAPSTTLWNRLPCTGNLMVQRAVYGSRNRFGLPLDYRTCRTVSSQHADGLMLPIIDMINQHCKWTFLTSN